MLLISISRAWMMHHRTAIPTSKSFVLETGALYFIPREWNAVTKEEIASRLSSKSIIIIYRLNYATPKTKQKREEKNSVKRATSVIKKVVSLYIITCTAQNLSSMTQTKQQPPTLSLAYYQYSQGSLYLWFI